MGNGTSNNPFFAWNNSFKNMWSVIKQHMIGFPLPIALYRALNSEHFFTLFQGTQQCFSLCLNIEELNSSWDILCLDHVRGMSPWVIQAIKTIVFRFWIFARVHVSTQSALVVYNFSFNFSFLPRFYCFRFFDELLAWRLQWNYFIKIFDTDILGHHYFNPISAGQGPNRPQCL